MTAQEIADLPLSQVVAGNIRAEVARRGWTQLDLGRHMGMSRVAVGDRYRNRTPWTVDEIERAAHLFGVRPADLLARPKGLEPLTFWLGAGADVIDLDERRAKAVARHPVSGSRR